MSEDDTDMNGPDGPGSNRVDRDLRAPRFSWTPAYETTFFRSLCDSVQLGLRENSSFKAEAWERAAQALQAKNGAYPAKSHLINKSDNARKRFRLWRGLRENPDFIYSPMTRTVTGTEEAWKAHIEREPLSRALRGRPFDHEDYMEILYPDVIGSGGAPKRIIKPKRRVEGQQGDDSDTPGTGVLHLHADSAPARPTGSPDRRRASLSQPPTNSNSDAPAQGTRACANNVPPRNSATQPCALTPRKETNSVAKKRILPVGPSDGPLDSPPPCSTIPYATAFHSAPSPEKRQRTFLLSDALCSATTNNLTPLAVAAAAPPPCSSSTTSLSGLEGHSILPRPLPEEAERPRPTSNQKWQELALDLFFREFADRDADLQIKVAETVLCDDHRALVFCKMPWRMRQHWIKRFEGGLRSVA